MSTTSRVYISLVIAAGTLILGATLFSWESANLLRFVAYMGLAGLGGVLKIRLPGVTGTLSAGYLIVLLAASELSTPETVAAGMFSVFVQYAWQSAIRLRLIQATFNICNAAIGAWLASQLVHSSLLVEIGLLHPLRLTAAALAYFLSNCVLIAGVISLTENKPLQKIIKEYYLWSLPFYLVAAGIVEGIHQLGLLVGWQTAVLVLPLVFAVYQVWSVYADRVEGERKRQEEARIHAEEMSSLHLRTIHALAMAIEARDRTTHDHLRRVQIYAVEMGREMGLNDHELEGLRTAAVLHDIGKLGVPEHIISKPGRLTPEEFEKVQAHPVVGAEILERVNFPWEVVPIVRCHHERWDGSGYPAGLKGTDIPVGARILSVVDCFDALASDRQYRKAMSTDQAMGVIQKAAGKDFDPEVVKLLVSRYADLEAKVKNAAAEEPPMMTRQEIREAVPAAGFQSAIQAGRRASEVNRLISSVSGAIQSASRGGTLPDLKAAMRAADAQLRPALGYEMLAVFLREGPLVRLSYLSGCDELDAGAVIAVGQGLSGWVVEEGRPILNGNGRLDALVQAVSGNRDLPSASSVPILAGDRTVGSLTAYSSAMDSFAACDLQVLLGVASQVGGLLIQAAAAKEEPAVAAMKVS